MNADVKVTYEKPESHTLVAEKMIERRSTGRTIAIKEKGKVTIVTIAEKMDIQRIDAGICIHTSRLVQIKIRRTMLLLQIPQSQ